MSRGGRQKGVNDRVEIGRRRECVETRGSVGETRGCNRIARLVFYTVHFLLYWAGGWTQDGHKVPSE